MNYFNTVFFAVTFVACVAHLNRVHRLPFLRMVAFALVAAGSLGSAIEPWCHTHDDEIWWHTMFRVGVAMVAVLYFGLDRRKRPQCPTPMPPECASQFVERRFTRTL